MVNNRDVEDYKKLVIDKFKNDTVKVNDKTYIDIDVFMNSIRESMIYESLLGVLIKNQGKIKVSDEEILMYISNDYDKTDLSYDGECCTLVSNK
jgi:hypothetical protein